MFVRKVNSDRFLDWHWSVPCKNEFERLFSFSLFFFLILKVISGRLVNFQTLQSWLAENLHNFVHSFPNVDSGGWSILMDLEGPPYKCFFFFLRFLRKNLERLNKAKIVPFCFSGSFVDVHSVQERTWRDPFCLRVDGFRVDGRRHGQLGPRESH